jgi:hypothetical protein
MNTLAIGKVNILPIDENLLALLIPERDVRRTISLPFFTIFPKPSICIKVCQIKAIMINDNGIPQNMKGNIFPSSIYIM